MFLSRRNRGTRELLAFAVVSSCLSTIVSADWPRFRGPNGSGVAENITVTNVEVTQENLVWRQELPGAGVSSPIVVGNRIFVTAYNGYGEPNRSGKLTDLERSIICYDQESGKELWKQTIKAVQPEDEFAGMGVPAHGYASHTPASDGERVYAFFGKSGVYAWDLEGKELWNKSVGAGSDPRAWGSSSSPVLVRDLVVVTAGPETRAVVALNKMTGEEVWRSKSDAFGDVWGTPVVLEKAEADAQVVIGAPYEIWAINAKTGKLDWFAEAMDTDQFNSSVTTDGKMIYAIEGRGGGAIAILPEGKGDITKDNVRWRGNHSGRFATPVVLGNRIYNISGGIYTVINAEDGKEIFQGRLPAPASSDSGRGRGRGRGGDYASPVAADGKLFYINNGGTLYVLAAADDLQVLGTSQIAEGESFGATPAIDGDSIYLRSNKALYRYRLR